MNPLQESKQELNAAIRYAENAISSAKQTMESMNTYQEQTGREQALSEDIDILILENTKLKLEAKDWNFDNTNLQEANDHLEVCVADLKVRLAESKPTMPVIPKDVAIAIFREGVQHGVEATCTELEGQSINISEDDYVGDFSISFERNIDLNDELDLDWMRGKCGDYDESSVIDALGNLCADKKFECRIHGVDDQEEKKNN